MNIPFVPSPETQAALSALQTAVAKALHRKKQLGQYAVFWRDGKIVYQDYGHQSPKLSPEEFQDFLLNSPEMSEEEFEYIQQKRAHFNEWK